MATSDTSGVPVLSKNERRLLQRCEATIAKGEKVFVEVGLAMARVRDQKLYRETDDTFEGYCKRKWGFEKSQAYRLIDASAVVADLSPMGELPKNERQARELGKAPPEKRQAVMEAVVKEGKPTAARIKEVVEERIGGAKVKPAVNGNGNHVGLSETAVAELVKPPTDSEGTVIPPRLIKAFEVLGPLTKAINLISHISEVLNPVMGDADKIKPAPGGEFLAVHRQQIKADLKNAMGTIKDTAPYAVCPYCKSLKNKCEACKGLGWVPKQTYKSAPPELRK